MKKLIELYLLARATLVIARIHRLERKWLQCAVEKEQHRIATLDAKLAYEAAVAEFPHAISGRTISVPSVTASLKTGS
jgi:hypothetical protein